MYLNQRKNFSDRRNQKQKFRQPFQRLRGAWGRAPAGVQGQRPWSLAEASEISGQEKAACCIGQQAAFTGG